MARFEKDDRVKILRGGRAIPARVTSRDGSHYNVLADNRRLYKHIFSGDLRHVTKEYVLLLEGNLAHGLAAYEESTKRRSSEFLAEYVRTLGLTPLVEKVHSRESLKYFIRRLAGRINVPFVHLSSHGVHEAGLGQVLFLTHDEIGLLSPPVSSWTKQTLDRRRREDPKWVDRILGYERALSDTFRDALNGKVLILSACSLGKKHGLAEVISRMSQASAVVAYEGDVNDDDAMIAEVMIYKCFTKRSMKQTPESIVHSVRKSLEKLSIVAPLVVWRDGDLV